MHGAYLEGTRTARNEGILEGLGPGGAALVRIHAGLDVIHLEVRRETELGRFQQGHVALSGHRYHQGGRVVRLQGILAQMGRYLEISHAAPKGCRSAGGQGFHMHLGRLGGHALADGHIVGAEEIVKDGAGGAALLDVHQAHHFGRLDGLVSGLLRDDDPAAEHGGIVHGSVHLLPLELNVGRGFHFLAPKAVKRGETGILKALQVGAVINLEGGGDGFSHYHGVAAQAKTHKDIGIGRGLRTGLRTLAAGGGTGAACRGGRRGGTVVHYLHGGGAGADFIALYLGCGGRNGEGAGLAGLQDVGVGGLGRTGGFSVDHLDAGGGAFLRAPHYGDVFRSVPAEIRGGVLAFHHEHQVETLGELHDVVNLYPDAALGPCGQAREEGGYDCKQSFHLHYQFFSFRRDLRASAFFSSTFSWVFFSLSWMACNSCWACWGLN